MTKIVLDLNNLISSGAYGDIFIGKDEKGTDYIVKSIKKEEDGVLCLNECIIMQCIEYPYLQTALSIYSDNDYTYILQEKAIRDLNLNEEGSEKEKLFYCFCVAQALSVLHSCNIIHGDIKGSNCLLFKNGVVKLADFSLSIKLWSSDKVITAAGTSTHRAPENVTDKICSKPFDIWALGCTFYEIMHGTFLFPVNKGSNIGELNSRKGEFYDLIRSMLKEKPEDRINISQVLKSPCFKDFKRETTYKIKLPLPKIISSEENKKIENRLSKSLSGYTLKFACQLYKYIADTKINEDTKILAIILLAYKLTTCESINLGSRKEEVLKAEQLICHYLHFRFNIF